MSIRKPNRPQNNRDFGTYGESFPPLSIRISDFLYLVFWMAEYRYNNYNKNLTSEKYGQQNLKKIMF